MIDEQDQRSEAERPFCGLVMPISAIDGCTEQHWLDVKQIITEAVELAGFKANLVSYADDIGIIQKRIIQNLYDNPIIVCDVSGKNPNVMFELGLRLAFDKPTIIIKDDKTSYSFDTAPIEHVEYPRDLRFNKINEFKRLLADKIKGTLEKSVADPNYTTFLKHFGTFTISKLDSKEVSKEDFILEELKELRKVVMQQLSTSKYSIDDSDYASSYKMNLMVSNGVRQVRDIIHNELKNMDIKEVSIHELKNYLLVKLEEENKRLSILLGASVIDEIIERSLQDHKFR